jgi:hypothetical protein
MKADACWLKRDLFTSSMRQVKNVGGDSHLGGQDFDWELMKVALRVSRARSMLTEQKAPGFATGAMLSNLGGQKVGFYGHQPGEMCFSILMTFPELQSQVWSADVGLQAPTYPNSAWHQGVATVAARLRAGKEGAVKA